MVIEILNLRFTLTRAGQISEFAELVFPSMFVESESWHDLNKAYRNLDIFVKSSCQR